MIGRGAYHNPLLLSELHKHLRDPSFVIDEADFLARYKSYMQLQLAGGERLQPLMRHLLHSFNGRPGARRFRRTLSDHQRLKQGDASILGLRRRPVSGVDDRSACVETGAHPAGR